MAEPVQSLVNVDGVVDTLLQSEQPAIRYKLRRNVLREPEAAPAIRSLRSEIRNSSLARQLLRNLQPDGRIQPPDHVYAKWQGAHWIAAALADCGYPAGDPSLAPVRDQLQDAWLAEPFYEEFEARSKGQAYRRAGVPIMQGRHRRCASQQANALWSILELGLADARTANLVERLLHWQWPDGGWNCDKNPAASHSSFMESILPLRALALYARQADHEPAARAAERAKEVFLERELFRRRRDGSVIRQDFTLLHYPVYWHYDVLHGLKVLAEAGYVDDPRCRPALDLLVSKQLPHGGWPAERRYYTVSAELARGHDAVDWGPTGKKRMNPWVSVDALFVLRAAGMLRI